MFKIFLVACCVALVLALATGCGAENRFTSPSGMPDILFSQPQLPDVYLYDDGYDDYASQYDSYVALIQVEAPGNIAEARPLRLSMRNPLTLNPLTNQDVTVDRVLGLIFEPLIVLDDTFQPTSHLAEIEFASDFQSVMVVIRSDAFWADGMPVTSDDLIFTVDTLRAGAADSIYYNNVQNIASIHRINSRSVEIQFIHPSPPASAVLGFPVVPRHHYQGQAQETSNAMSPLGNGPFLLYSFSPTGGMVLKPNPTSFRPRPGVDTVEVVFLPDDTSDLYAFDQGRIDAINLPLTTWASHHSVRHPNYQIIPAMYFEFIGFNFGRENFNNRQVRQGIAQAFDISQVVQTVYLNHAVRAYSPIHPGSFISSGVEGLAYNPTVARHLLNAVTFEYPIHIIANRDNPQRVSIAHQLATSLTGIGFDAWVEVLDGPDYFWRIDHGHFDLFIGGVQLEVIPNVEFLFNGQGIFMENLDLMAAFGGLSSFFNMGTYMQTMAQFETLFARELPVVSLAFRHSAVLTNGRITQNVPPALDSIFAFVNMWEVE